MSAAPPPSPTGTATKPLPGAWLGSYRDDAAYVLPFVVFMAFTVLGGQEGWFPLSYLLKTLIVSVMIWYFWPCYTRIRWTHLGLGAFVGVVGVVQWVGTERLILALWPDYPRMGSDIVPKDWFKEFATVEAAWAFLALRWAGSSLLVPVMEELFWRDYLHRQILAPNDFKMAGIGEWDFKAFAIVAVVFGAGVHTFWITAPMYGFLIGGLLVYTRSLGSCIVCHAVTNFLLGAYVMWYRDWYFW